jgi:cysteine desulfurase
LLGGKQEGGRRAGTENVAIIAAMMAALDVREKQIRQSEHLLRKVWRDNFEAQFLRAMPGATILGHNQPRLWNTVSVLMPEGDRKSQWVIRLDKAGFAVSTGSACTTGKEEPSHVLAAMGYKGAHALRAVRFSAGWETNEAEWDALLKAVVKVHGEMQHKT